MVQTTFSEKKEKIKNRKNKKSGFCHIRAYVRVKDEKQYISPDVDAVKHQNIAFKPIFSPIERILYDVWTIYPPCPRKRLRTP